jgi:hypothetical protein
MNVNENCVNKNCICKNINDNNIQILYSQYDKLYEHFVNKKKLRNSSEAVCINLNYELYDNNNFNEQIINNQKTCRYLIEKPRDFKNQILGMSENRMKSYRKMNAHKQWNDDETKNYAFKQLLSMYYSIYKVNEIKELYMLESNIYYDYVFRLRFDVTPRDVIRAQDYEPNFIYYLDIGQPDNLISDWLNFGSNAIMNIYASVFLSMEYLNTFRFMKKEDREENNIEASDKYSGVSEFFIRDIMYLHKIPKRGIKTKAIITVAKTMEFLTSLDAS